MLVSRGESGQRKFAFIHVQKTGGTSVEELLRAAVPDITYHPPRHMGAGLARQKLEDWDERFTFAFVRNPWDRLASWYSMIEGPRRAQEGQGLPPDAARLERIQRNPLLAHALEVLEKDSSFESFVKRCTGEFRRDGAIYSFTRNQIDYLTTIWLYRSGRLLVDFVGRFEYLREDLKWVFSELGLEPGLVEDALPHSNESYRELGHYRNFYTAETAAIVGERFAKDIAYFGYDFEGEESMRFKVLAALDRGMTGKEVSEVFGVPLPKIRGWLARRNEPAQVASEPITGPRAHRDSSNKVDHPPLR